MSEEGQIEKNKLFVGNLPYTIDEEALLKHFSNVELDGDKVEVVEAKIITDKFSGRSKGFGFVTMKTPEMAQAAIDALNNKELEGRQVFVNVARPMEKRDNNRGGYDRNNYKRDSYR